MKRLSSALIFASALVISNDARAQTANNMMVAGNVCNAHVRQEANNLIHTYIHQSNWQHVEGNLREFYTPSRSHVVKIDEIAGSDIEDVLTCEISTPGLNLNQLASQVMPILTASSYSEVTPPSWAHRKWRGPDEVEVLIFNRPGVGSMVEFSKVWPRDDW